jgi:septal ring factor EnvC (AmiA/AmiB activator)
MTDKNLLQKFGEIIDNRMAEGLKPVNNRLDSVGKQLTEQNSRLGGVEKQLTEQSNRLGGVEKQIKTSNRRLTRVAKDVSYIAKNFDMDIVNNRRRIQRIENQLDISPPQQ